MSKDSQQVQHVSAVVAEMRARAEVCNTLYGGTTAMRKSGKTYLPMWPQESEKTWEARRDCSVLFPAFRKAIGVMVGKPLGSPISFGDDVPTRLETLAESIDNQDRDIDAFARDVAMASLRDGITWVLADHTPSPAGATLAEEKALGARPYLIHIPLSNMLGWRFYGGKLVQLRYLETIAEADGLWGEKHTAQVRVWEPGRVQTWRRGDAHEWVLASDTPVSLPDIPCVPIYGHRVGLWQAEPPLEDLAWLNVQHWQSSSDQRNVLHVARVPFLAAEEDARQDQDAPVTIAASGIVVGFKGLAYVEHGGAAISAGRQDLVDIEDQMRRVAGELISRTVQKTATEAALESAEGDSWLRAWTRSFEDALEACLGWMAAWIGEPSGGSLSLDFDWDDATLAADMLAALTNARTSGEISRETYLSKLKDGNILPPGRTVAQEMDALEAEGPSAFPMQP